MPVDVSASAIARWCTGARPVRQQIKQSFAYCQQATRLLDAAKRAVEIAIEDSEAAALAWLQNTGVPPAG